MFDNNLRSFVHDCCSNTNSAASLVKLHPAYCFWETFTCKHLPCSFIQKFKDPKQVLFFTFLKKGTLSSTFRYSSSIRNVTCTFPGIQLPYSGVIFTVLSFLSCCSHVMPRALPQLLYRVTGEIADWQKTSRLQDSSIKLHA